MENKIVFFDIDGTLLNHEGIVCDSTLKALEELKENGHLRFICTGRTKCMLPSAITSIDFDGYVYGGGTHLEYRGDMLQYFEIPQEKLRQTLEILKRYQVTYAVEGRDRVYIEPEALEDERRYFKVFIRNLQEVIEVIEPDKDIHASKITFLAPFSMKPEELKAMEQELEEYYNVIIHEVQDTKVITDGLIEIVPRPFNKGTGIKDTIEHLDIAWENTIGVGDSNNDLEMLSYVNTPVVMGNGSTKAKELAKIITTHIDEDGIMDGMKQLALV